MSQKLEEKQSLGIVKFDKGAVAQSGFLGKIIQSLGVVFAFGILISAFILVIEVFLRYVLNAPTIWAHETVIFINASAFVFGGLYAVARDGHIRVVLLYDLMGKNLKRIANIIISLVCMVSVAMFSWAAWLIVVRAAWTPQGDFRLETSGSAWNPPTPGLLKIFLFLMLAVMTVQFLILSINYFRRPSSMSEE